MDELAALKSMGWVLPSPAYVFGAIVFGLVGIAAFRLGRKNERPVTLWLGVALMLFPYLVSNTLLLYLVGVGLCVGVVVDHRR